MHNGKYQCHMAASCTYHLPTKSLTLNEKCLRIIWGETVRRMDHQQKNDKTEKARGLGRKTREEVGKGNQMTALKVPVRE